MGLKLFWSSRSPFVRKVMIVAHELGVANQIEAVRTVVHPAWPNSDVMKYHPLSRIPVLLVDETPIYDSRVIIDYLDHTFGAGALTPADPPRRWTSMTRHALGDAMMEAAVQWLIERARPDPGRDDALIASCRLRLEAALDVMNADEDLMGPGFDAGQIAVASALLYLDFRFRANDWREGRAALARWVDGVAERPSVRATTHLDTY